MSEGLKSLQQRIRSSRGDYDRELDGDIDVAMHGGEIVWKTANYTMDRYPARKHASKHHLGGIGYEHVPSYTASLDACVCLLHQKFKIARFEIEYDPSGCGATLVVWGQGLSKPSTTFGESVHFTPALALLDAILSAFISENEAKIAEASK